MAASEKKTPLIATPRSSVDLRDQYEGWRRALLQGTRDPLVGVGVLIGRGLAAWVRLARTSRPVASIARAAPSRRSTVPEGLQADLLQVWTQMALSVRSSEYYVMTRPPVAEKVTPRHLRRAAYLYVRQSTLRQVLENTESTHRQYALRQRAVALGWPVDQIVVIDSDLGQSGASAADREGFQRLVRDVSLGRAGLVMGLEVSRLARNSTDWHRLLETLRADRYLDPR